MLSFIRYYSRILLKGVDTLSKYYSIHEFSKIIGVSAQMHFGVTICKTIFFSRFALQKDVISS